jgi:hypothetical protein
VYVRSGINVAIVAAKSGITYDIEKFCERGSEHGDLCLDIGTMEDQEKVKRVFGKN